MEANMTTIQFVRYSYPGEGQRVGVRLDETVYDLSSQVGSLASWLRTSVGRVPAAIQELVAAAQHAERSHPAAQFDQTPAADRPHWLAPVDEQDVWAAGVTYERSRVARQEEAADGGDVYARVYMAKRPEIFFKARGPWVVGTHGQVGIRRDAIWNVPEPELALVFNPQMEIVGVTAGNDMSSRDIEGENPLYLPQAKIYTASCALGPGIALDALGDAWPEAGIALKIARNGEVVFSGETHTRQIRRRPLELAHCLSHSLNFPDGAVLLTGTGVVPPENFTLAAGDVVTVAIDGVGALTNTVMVV
jgi:2-dehydro-3-deoxy-D-arabinonate dehydratase